MSKDFPLKFKLFIEKIASFSFTKKHSMFSVLLRQSHILPSYNTSFSPGIRTFSFDNDQSRTLLFAGGQMCGHVEDESFFFPPFI